MDFDHYLNQNKVRIQLEKFQLGDLLLEIKDIFEDQAQLKGLQFEIKMDQDVLELDLSSDPIRIKQILINLISNSIKFTTQGKITLQVGFSQSQHFSVEFKVIDTGKGINLEQQKKLFNFRSSFDQVEGHGIGLAISQKLALRLGSKDGISIQSKENEGTCFSFSIQIHLQEKNQTQKNKKNNSLLEQSFNIKSQQLIEQKQTLELRNSRLPRTINKINEENENQRKSSSQQDMFLSDFDLKNKKNINILFVDDEPYNHIAVKQTIKKYKSFQFFSAFSGQTAISILIEQKTNNQPIDIVILDYEMPLLNGFQTNQQIQNLISQKILPQTVVVLSSSYTSSQEINFKQNFLLDPKIIQSFDLVVDKPINHQNIKQILEFFQTKL